MVVLLVSGLALSPPAVGHGYEPAAPRSPTTSRADLPGRADRLGDLVQEGPEQLHLVLVDGVGVAAADGDQAPALPVRPADLRFRQQRHVEADDVVVRVAEDLHYPAVELQDQGTKDQFLHLLHSSAGYFRSR